MFEKLPCFLFGLDLTIQFSWNVLPTELSIFYKRHSIQFVQPVTLQTLDRMGAHLLTLRNLLETVNLYANLETYQTQPIINPRPFFSSLLTILPCVPHRFFHDPLPTLSVIFKPVQSWPDRTQYFPTFSNTLPIKIESKSFRKMKMASIS